MSVATAMSVISSALRFGRSKDQSEDLEVSKKDVKQHISLTSQIETDEFVKSIRVKHAFPNRASK